MFRRYGRIAAAALVALAVLPVAGPMPAHAGFWKEITGFGMAERAANETLANEAYAKRYGINTEEARAKRAMNRALFGDDAPALERRVDDINATIGNAPPAPMAPAPVAPVAPIVKAAPTPEARARAAKAEFDLAAKVTNPATVEEAKAFFNAAVEAFKGEAFAAIDAKFAEATAAVEAARAEAAVAKAELAKVKAELAAAKRPNKTRL